MFLSSVLMYWTWCNGPLNLTVLDRYSVILTKGVANETQK